jgi:hypothetical protein
MTFGELQLYDTFKIPPDKRTLYSKREPGVRYHNGDPINTVNLKSCLDTFIADHVEVVRTADGSITDKTLINWDPVDQSAPLVMQHPKQVFPNEY